MRYYLYKFADNWADEMDLEGFIALTEIQKDIALARIKKEFKRGGSIGFGTNEDNEYDSLEDVMNCISIKEISQSQYSTIISLFGTSFGETGPISEYDIDSDYDDEDYDDEEEEDLDEEDAYDSQAQKIVDFIKLEYGLEEGNSGNAYADFKWRPTTKTEIVITVGEYSGGDEEVELSLKLNGKDVDYESFNVDEVHDDPKGYLKEVITKFIEKAKKY